MKRRDLFFIVLLVGFAVIGRLCPHPWNATPMMAVGLVAGVYLGTWQAVLAVFASAYLSDALIGGYEPLLMLVVYASYALVAFGSRWLRQCVNVTTVLFSSVLASTLFFLLTNWAVWQFTPWYAHTASGLLSSFELGLPFYRNALLGDAAYTACLFGLVELARWFYPQAKHLYQRVVGTTTKDVV